ncbi:MAG: hypothetical protein AAGF99_10610 [Bacteroidota bacterium]
MRYLTPNQVRSQLAGGRAVEQLLPSPTGVVAYVSVYRDRQGCFTVWHAECEDVGSVDFIDLYEFPDIDPDAPEGRGLTFESADAALAHSHRSLGASPESWLGRGMIQDVYAERKRKQTQAKHA